ncbi:Apoptosis facilitator Bcl-2-like protein 14 [Chelonia mydas]|uniref:Apoptosis facilitator Bcl-2-like protein 14 n=1 Tax=Chelonia mydas TaxID=8469 RepID=M7BRV2_CHEMY|nr:Apoptosis facilitator Bcl-2-like protein 14 [Chelonia mydas]
MKSASDANMEEISLEDEDRDTVEYKVLMAYAQRRLSVSKYGQLLEREAKTLKGSTTERGEREEIPQAKEGERHQELSVQDKGPAAQRKKQRKKKFMQRCLLLFSCARGEKEKGPQELATNQDTVNGYGLKLQMALQTSSPESEDEEERIIETIVALLRQSGDKLEEMIKRDSTFYHCVTKMLSYAFFKKLTDQYLEEVPGDSTKETEGKIQCTKAAFVMEVTTRLTAVDNHPMNMVLGFGVKYLKENFSPWIQNHGGWHFGGRPLSRSVPSVAIRRRVLHSLRVFGGRSFSATEDPERVKDVPPKARSD